MDSEYDYRLSDAKAIIRSLVYDFNLVLKQRNEARAELEAIRAKEREDSLDQVK